MSHRTKTILVLIFILLIGAFFFVLTVPEGEHKPDPVPGVTLHIIEFEGCEYIYGSRGQSRQGAMLTHKGNCKYCAERNQQVKVVREPVFRVPNEPVRHTTQCIWPD